MSEKPVSRAIVLLVAAWIFVVGGGVYAVQRYKSTPGEQVPPPAMWPADSTLQRTADRSTLIMMSHPQCPCTRASLTELETLLSEFGNKVTAYVLFVQPPGTDFEWVNTDLWKSASGIPGVHVIRDENGVEANRFDGLTSGEVVLYNADGQLQFNGGITGARGHVGDNIGLHRLGSLLSGAVADRNDSPVFGCPLHSEVE